MKTDAQIQQDVLRELHWDPRVEETEIGVEVHQGVVTLTGTVSGYPKRLAAAEAAHRVAGVLDVANDVQVKPPDALKRTDTEIAQAVRRALEWDVRVPHQRIQSTVSDGWVSLGGTVSFWHEREDAERAVRNLAGVRGVSNNIALAAAPTVDAESVRKQVAAALERRAERTAERMQIGVGDGTVTLSGSVRSWTEREAVLEAVRGTPGVRTVNDHLRIEMTL